MKKAVYILIGLLLPFCINAQSSRLECLTIEQGLSQGMVFDILQTRDGFLWIATKDGLNRYDGYNFKVFSNDAFNPFSLAENTVNFLFEDSRGWLWVGTESKGLDLFDPRMERFHHFPMDYKETIAGIGVSVDKILEAADGTIWALKQGVGLVRVPIPADWKTKLPDEPDLEALTTIAPLQLTQAQGCDLDWLFNFSILENGDFLATTSHGQFMLNTQRCTCTPANVGLLPTSINTVLLADETSESDMWVGNLTELWRVRNGKATAFPILPALAPQWTGLHPGKDGHVWFVVNRSLWDLAPGEDIDFSKPDLNLDENPNSLKVDRNGNIWIGTVGYGLRKFNPAKNLFHAGAKGRSIMGLWRSPTGKYYGKSRTTYTFIFDYDPKTGRLGERTAFPDAPVQHIGLAFEPDGATWLLCTSPEMKNQRMLRRYDANGDPAKAYIFDAILTLQDLLLRSRDGLLWVSSSNCQLVHFNPRTEQFDNLNFSHLFGKKASSVRTTALAEDEDGTLWIGTQLGLVKCTPSGKSFDFQLIQADLNNRPGLNNNSIACLLPDANGILWIGTKGGGINRYDQRSGQFQHITTHDGLPNNVVYGILSGDKNELWCSTNRGLAKIKLSKSEQGLPLSFDITAFTANMGLQDNEFNSFAFSKSENGELLFGGVNGLNHFFPAELRLDTTPPPVFVVGLEINHQSANFGSPNSPLTQPLEHLRELNLSYEQNNLSFEFAALDFTDPAKNRYRYRLVGLDEDWVETGTLRFAHFTHLSPGKYEFRVQGSNGESAWQDAANAIVVIITPPWWKSKLVYFLYFLLAIGTGWRIYKLQIRRVKLREQLAFEHRETERVRALEQMKTNFFSNVTHEFRTPLTLIIEPLRQILKNPNDPALTEKIRLAEKNSQRLLGMVNQLLDLAKLEGKSMALDLRRGDFEQVVRDVFESFLHLAEQRGIKLTMSAPNDIPPFEFDKGKVELVMNNLISNALKFTPEGGRVVVEIQNPSLRDLNGHPNSNVRVTVTDTGIGIPAEAQDKIFDRFYQVDSSHTRAGEGTGIGLSLSKELAELMGGGISAKSEVGKGSTFTFWLPLEVGVGAAVPTVIEAQTAAPTFSKKSPDRQFAEGERPVVLVVEDNAELRAFIRQSIGENWQVVEAVNGAEGVERAVELLPDMVVSDVMMPVKDGYALCDDLKSNEMTAHLPIILLTAKSALDSKLKGLRTGADDYLTKPFHTEELLARMENLVEVRRKLQQHYGKHPVVEVAQNGNILPAPDREFLRKFTVLLEQNLSDENLGVEDFSKKMFISRVQLHRKLKAITDRSATDFIRDFRLERAHAMLKNREGLVSEIALNVGFGNEKYFSTVFKEKFGVSPRQVM
ncbi:MAG: response regulator [Saprospiraceae bacterium]|nr:response regulator [Saprospiraceae bacterium]